MLLALVARLAALLALSASLASFATLPAAFAASRPTDRPSFLLARSYFGRLRTRLFLSLRANGVAFFANGATVLTSATTRRASTAALPPLASALRPFPSALDAFPSSLDALTRHRGFGALAPEMSHDEMHFLDTWRVLARDDEAEIAALRKAGALRARHAEHGEPSRARRLDRSQHVGRAAARRHRDEEIALFAKRLDLTRVHAAESGIVSDRGENGAIGGERDRGHRASVAKEAADQLGGEVLSLGGASAVSAKEDGFPARGCLGEPPCHALEKRFLPLEGLREEKRARGHPPPDRAGRTQAASPPAARFRDAR